MFQWSLIEHLLPLLLHRSVGLAHSSPERSFVLEFLQSRTLWDPGHIRCTFTRHMCHWMKEVPKFLSSFHLGSLHVSAPLVMCVRMCVCMHTIVFV